MPRNLSNHIKLRFKGFDKRQLSLSIRQQLFIFSVLINFLFIPLGIASPNEGSRYLLTKTIVINNSFSWPANWANNSTGYWFFPDFGINQGYISDLAPGLSFILVPFYILGKILYGILGGPVISSNAYYSQFDSFIIYFLKIMLVFLAGYTTVKLFDLLNLLSPNKIQNIIITIIASFGTLFFLYTPTLLPTLLTGFLYISIIFYLIKFDTDGKKSDLVLAGIFSGFAVVVEYGSLVMIPWFIWYLLSKELIISKKIRYKDLFLYVGTFILGILPFFVYNFYLSGNPLQTGYSFSHWFSQINFYFNIVSGLIVLFFDINKGLFIFNPILLLACFGFLNRSYFKVHAREVILVVMPCIAFIIFYAKNFDPTGGTIVGPRYIIPLIPILAIGLQGWFLFKNKILICLNSFFIFISFLNTILTVLGIGIFPSNNEINPIYSDSIPNILKMKFNPILFKTNLLLCILISIFIIAAIIILNYNQYIIFINYLIKKPFSELQFVSVQDEIHISETTSLLNSQQQKTLLFSTLWLFILFLIGFFVFGIEFLSRGYYPNVQLNGLSDTSLIELLIILSSLLTINEYSSFNLKKFIKGG